MASSRFTVRSLDRAQVTARSSSVDPNTGLPSSINGFERDDKAVIRGPGDHWTLYRQNLAGSEERVSIVTMKVALKDEKVRREVERLLTDDDTKGSSGTVSPLIVCGDDPAASSSERFWALHLRSKPSSIDVALPSDKVTCDQSGAGSGSEI